MIEVAISYGFGEDNRYKLSEIPPDIQLALFQYDIYAENREKIITSLELAETNVAAVHLPMDTLRREPKEILDMINEFNTRFACQNFIVHPNRNFRKFMFYFLENKARDVKYDYRLCIETFQWRKKKELRSPLDIMEMCIKHHDLSMCIDTSHIEQIWFDYKIMKSLLKHTSVIHLSNRAKGHGSHMPFNSPKGELNLVGFVKELKRRYKWRGTIVLEYMPEHQHKLMRNYFYIKKLLE